MNSTLTSLNPVDTQRTIELRTWFDNEGKLMDLPDLSKNVDIGNQQDSFKTLSQINADGLDLNNKPDYFNIKAIVTYIRKETIVYMVR